MRLLITGAGGMLGREVRDAASDSGHEAIALPRADLDITDLDRLAAVVREVRPDVVVNCAAWTKVDAAEAAPEAVLAVNGRGAGNVAWAADASAAWTIQLSTDYVFDGSKREPYLESDPPAPLSVYGRSKLAGEWEVARQAPRRHTIVRSAWLFGRDPDCFPAKILRLAAERDELAVVDDQVGCPTYCRHLARALVEIAAGRRWAGIVHVAGGGACSWYELAREVIATAGLRCRIEPVCTPDLNLPAPRPSYSALASEPKVRAPRLPHWREGVVEFLTAARSATEADGSSPQVPSAA